MRTQDNVFPEDILIPHFGKDSNIVGIEIGVAGGSGSVGMLWRMPNLRLYCIDPWRHVDLAPFEAGHPQSEHDSTYAEAVNRIGQFSGRATIIKKCSDDAVYDVPRLVDFIFIDGHHTLEQATRDIQNYSPKVRPGGIIAGHDYHQVPEVTWAVNKSFEPMRIRQAEDFIWWVIA